MANYSFDDNGNQLPPKNKTVTEINEYIKWMAIRNIILTKQMSCMYRSTPWTLQQEPNLN